jgi:hypothetical protein
MQTGSLDEKKFLSDISRIAKALERLVEIAEGYAEAEPRYPTAEQVRAEREERLKRIEAHYPEAAAEARRPWTGGPR